MFVWRRDKVASFIKKVVSYLSVFTASFNGQNTNAVFLNRNVYPFTVNFSIFSTHEVKNSYMYLIKNTMFNRNLKA